jgi:hypothetical protein
MLQQCCEEKGIQFRLPVEEQVLVKFVLWLAEVRKVRDHFSISVRSKEHAYCEGNSGAGDKITSGRADSKRSSKQVSISEEVRWGRRVQASDPRDAEANKS